MSKKKLASTNPASGKLIEEYQQHDRDELAAIIQGAEKAAKEWSRTGLGERSVLMMKAASNLRKDIEKYARLITTEMGKPILQSKAEVEKCAGVCEYYAENAENFLANEYVDAGGRESFVAFNPLGVVLAVMPWNFPYWQVFRFAAPALMAGNGALLKHASNVTGTALAIEALFRETGFPGNLFRILKLGSRDVGKVIEDPVASIISAEDEEDAIRIANDTQFGLGAAVFTRDIERGRDIAGKQLQAGYCFVNDFVRSDPRLPFGGIGHSGYGRELSYFGIREFTNIKTVFVK